MQKILYGIGALVALFLLGGLLLPAKSQFVVSADVDAPRATVFALVNDMQRANLWAPVAVADPNARVVYAGPARGEGSTVTWDGSIAGSGTQTISLSQPYERIETTINAGEDGESHTAFEFAEGAGFTRVSWRFEHDYGLNIVGRYVGLMITGVIRQEFEKHIESLRELAETLPRADFSGVEIEQLVVESMDIAYLRTRSAPAAGSTSEAMGEALFEVLYFIDENNLAEAGAPLSIARAFDGAQLSFDSAIPVRGLTSDTARDGDGVRIGQTYAGPVLRVKHVGSYRRLGETHRKIAAYIAALGIERNGDSWESYVSDPTKTDEAELLTYIYYPVRTP